MYVKLIVFQCKIYNRLLFYAVIRGMFKVIIKLYALYAIICSGFAY